MCRRISRLILFTSLATLWGCGGSSDDNSAPSPTPPEIRDYADYFAPLPDAIHPASNPYSDAKATLGELLFWDPILSGNQDVACATCHHPAFGWADGRNLSIGIGGLGLGPERIGDNQTLLHSPTILDTAFTGLTLDSDPATFSAGGYFWNLRSATLEEQALDPIRTPLEMRGSEIPEAQIFDIILERLKANNEYQSLFLAAFGSPGSQVDEVITAENLARAIATFERGIVSTPSRFDTFLAGDDTALTHDEITGLNQFIDAGCASCHHGPMLSDNRMHLDKIVQPQRGAVRTPSLRNLVATPPYLQDGSLRQISDVIALFSDRTDLGIVEDADTDKIEAFLNTLDADFPANIPASVPSGLPVGGNI